MNRYQVCARCKTKVLDSPPLCAGVCYICAFGYIVEGKKREGVDDNENIRDPETGDIWYSKHNHKIKYLVLRLSSNYVFVLRADENNQKLFADWFDRATFLKSCEFDTDGLYPLMLEISERLLS